MTTFNLFSAQEHKKTNAYFAAMKYAQLVVGPAGSGKVSKIATALFAFGVNVYFSRRIATLFKSIAAA